MGIINRSFQLPDQLRSAVDLHGEMPVLVIADRKVAVESVTDIIDSARIAGVETISLATKPSEKGPTNNAP